MNNLRGELSNSLQTGFVDKYFLSNLDFRPQLIVNDRKAGKKVLTSIENGLKSCDEFWLSVAFVTTSGVATIINTLKELENKNKKGKLLVSQYLNFTNPEALRRILQFKNIDLRISVDRKFHSKGYLFKNGSLYDLIIGSSNLTQEALSNNVEWNLKVSATNESSIIYDALKEFSSEFEIATKVDSSFIDKYEILYEKQKKLNENAFEVQQEIEQINILPNSMQVEALQNISKQRNEGKRKSLLISATGTGKTYLSAFDAKSFKTKTLLFVVHRANIAKAAMKTFKSVFGNSRSMGLYSGDSKELDKDFIFSTVQTISKEDNLKQFSVNHFEYIIIDESHRAGAESYHRILNHFESKFLLGMTATPERTDGFDIFKLYEYNIAYEIRLNRALDEGMLCPFHYFGITDVSVNNKMLDEKSDFSLLVSSERINHIIEKIKFYGCDDGNVRGLVFCSGKEECANLSGEFNLRGYKTVALTGDSSEEQRGKAINQLESDDPKDKLDYIFTVDIFNEGIDIPRVNQIIMLRPTQSAIVFVQQLGRGLRKIENKEYLTVLDFIGNYSNNFLIPIALYGDTSYNKDSLRKLISSGSRFIPGASTINFDEISRKRIFDAIDAANMQLKKDLVADYKMLKFKLGRIPMMSDFFNYSMRDAQLYVNYAKSYFNFVQEQEQILQGQLNKSEIKLLELFCCEINNSKRVEECVILKELIQKGRVKILQIQKLIKDKYNYSVNFETIESAVANLNFEFVTENYKKKLMTVKEIYGYNILKKIKDELVIEPEFNKVLLNETFKLFLLDSVNFSIYSFDQLFDTEKFHEGFVLYRKYSRKDVFRILNWDKNPVAQNVGGYIISRDKSNCPIFVNYHKEDDISSTTKYEDGFINNSTFEWMSKSNRTLESPDVKAIQNYKLGMRLPLFIKKNNDEGSDFYYMGEVAPLENSFEQKKMDDDNGKKVSVVKLKFLLSPPVEESLYNYIIHDTK